MGALSGLLSKDMYPKPFKEEWWTRVKQKTDADGEWRFRGFYGEYKGSKQKLPDPGM
jgi:hypothetical protein